MGYIDLLNRFWRMDAEENFSSVETRLYLYLLHLCNRRRWPEWVEASNEELAAMLDVTPRHIRRIRGNLVRRGLLTIEVGGNGRNSKTHYYLSTPKRGTSETPFLGERGTSGTPFAKKRGTSETPFLGERGTSETPLPPINIINKDIIVDKDVDDARAREGKESMQRSAEKRMDYNAPACDDFRASELYGRALRQNGLTTDDLDDIVNEILEQWQYEGTGHESLKDAKRHLWQLIPIKANARRRQKEHSNGKDKHDRGDTDPFSEFERSLLSGGMGPDTVRPDTHKPV